MLATTIGAWSQGIWRHGVHVHVNSEQNEREREGLGEGFYRCGGVTNAQALTPGIKAA
jgi:hypothetical protein